MAISGTPPSLEQVGTIDSRLRREPGAIIELPGGTQLGVAYAAGSLTLSPDFKDVEGTVKSGSEWIYVRKDGVVLIDARVTIAFPKEVKAATATAPAELEDVLVDMTLKGTIDLTNTFTEPKGDVAYQMYKDGTAKTVLTETVDPKDPTKDLFFHNFTGSARFEGGNGKVDSDYTSRFVTSADFGQLQNLDRLVRRQFLVDGRVYISKVPHYDPTNIILNVWSAG